MSDVNKTGVMQELDARELKCPEPLMLVRNKIRSMQSGDQLKVLATDPTTTRDLQNFCRFMGHEMLSSNKVARDEGAGEFVYVIEKGSA